MIDRTPSPELASGLRALVAAVGRGRVAWLCGTRPDTVRLWCRWLTPGLRALVALQRLARETDGFDDLADMLAPLIEDRRRQWAWVGYVNSARLFAVSGTWPQPLAVRQERYRRGERWIRAGGPRWMMTRDDPPDPPDDFPADRIPAVRALLERQGQTLAIGVDGRWHLVRLGGWRPPH